SPIMRNFHFTTEVTYWFPYDASTDATLDFTGDDDVWVFLNGKLAVDLGGLHQPLADSVTVNSSTAGQFGLEAGNVYEIKVFHAERKTDGSTFKLTLSGFDATRSDCVAVCGDGIIGFGEECDNGDDNVEVDSGIYAACNTDCLLEGGYCGNGTLDEGEQCDDADPATQAGCTNCRILVVR
ncbi:MAG: fibro-slime domain-containing protein, partial [Polyangiaceae bacterium]|nr:fibro-slime domain-containing protein [Polyangiaceae bacterium]